jgi:hypothetical protein
MLLNCDQVFDVLTRGPFPTGEPEDEAVERHLRACHECRQLAEALRPAVALLHEAISADEALELPEYQGALPWKRPDRQRLSIARLATRSTDGPRTPPTTPPPTMPAATTRTAQPYQFVRLLAASLLIFALGAIIFGIAAAPNGPRRLAMPQGLFSKSFGPTEIADGLPTEKGLLTLASLKLPAACVPLTHRPLSAEHAAEIAAALANGSLGSLHCCTECHHAGLPRTGAAPLAALTRANCQACHRG